MAGNEKRMNPADSAGTDGAIEGQSPAENSTKHGIPCYTSCKKIQTETNGYHQTSRDNPSSCNNYHSTTSCRGINMSDVLSMTT